MILLFFPEIKVRLYEPFAGSAVVSIVRFGYFDCASFLISYRYWLNDYIKQMQPSIQIVDCTILRSSVVASARTFCLLELRAEGLKAEDFKPGQFINILCSQVDVLEHSHKTAGKIIRRPFSIHSITGKDSFEVLIEVVGPGTAWLAGRSEGDRLDVMLPLGNGLDIAKVGESTIVLVGGGIGIAPLHFFAQQALIHGKRVIVYIGVYDRASIPAEIIRDKGKNYILHVGDKLKKLGCEVLIATEVYDPQSDFTGYISDFFYQGMITEQGEVRLPDIRAIACGPIDMLRDFKDYVFKLDIPAMVLLEERMGCGYGACLSCVCHGYQRDENGVLTDRVVNKKICTDGPLFLVEEVILHGIE